MGTVIEHSIVDEGQCFKPYFFLICLGLCAGEAQGLKAEEPNCSVCCQGWGGMGALQKSG